MSGRSGYGRSKIVGKLINLPANMMMAGLAPKVGKPGWAIRLYWHRVDCCYDDLCRADPIKILRRYLTPGKWPGPAGWPLNSYTFGYAIGSDIELNTGMGIADYLGGGTVASESMPYYIILFDKEILSNNSQPPPAGLNLYRCDSVGTAPGAITTIPTTDFYYTLQGGGPSLGLGTKEYTEAISPLAISPWNIDLSGSFVDGDVGSGQWHNINNEFANGNIPFPNAGFWVGSAGGQYSKTSANVVFIVHKNVPTYFPGNPTAKAAMIFNISQLLVHSFQNDDTALTSIEFGPNPAATPCQQLMILENFNSISTTYFGSSVGTGNPLHINIADECHGVKAQAAIAPFTISSITGLPALEQLPL